MKVRNLLNGFVLAALIGICISFVNAGNLTISPSNGDVFLDCYAPYQIQMTTDGSETNAVDAKIFLNGDFTLHPDRPYTDVLPGMTIPATLGTGESTTGSKSGEEYLYINAYDMSGLHSGTDTSLVTVYLKPNLDTGTGNLDFYYAGANYNGDDSNITSGINNNTQYVDILDSVTNGEYSFAPNQQCPFRPYIDSSLYWQWTNVETSTGVALVYTSVVGGPDYSASRPTDWEIWTNTSVILNLTGGRSDVIEEIQINWVAMQDIPNIDLSGDNSLSYGHTFNITGNILSGFIGFSNIMGNEGNTYLTGGTKYDHYFNLDMFWLDTVSPDQNGYFTGAITDSGYGYITYTMTGINFSGWASNGTNGWHADWTTKDDEYKIISFSGTNAMSQLYGENLYDDYMNNTGYVVSGANTFKLVHNITFDSPWSGTVTFVDRAGNIGTHFIDATNITTNLTYTFKAWPQQYKANASTLDRGGLSGMLVKVAIYDGAGYNPSNVTDNLIHTGWLKTDNTGTTTFTGNLGDGSYDVVAKGAGTLGYLLTGVAFDQGAATIDYTLKYSSGFVLGDMYSLTSTTGDDLNLYTHSTYESTEGIINTTDVSRLVNVWLKWYPNTEAQAFDISYFVDTPTLGASPITYPIPLKTTALETHMQYHPNDLNADGEVDVNDFNIMIENMNATGYTMPF